MIDSFGYRTIRTITNVSNCHIFNVHGTVHR